MKVLMTGYTSFQCNVFRKKNHLYSGASGLAYALRSMDDIEFDNDTVYPETNLDQYDVVLSGFYAPHSLSSYRSLMLIPKLVKYARRGGHVRFYVDDWHLRQMYHGITSHRKPKNIERITDLQYKAHPDRQEYIRDHIDMIINFYEAVETAPMTIAIPKLPWAMGVGPQNEVMGGRVTFTAFEPSAVFPSLETEPVANREKAWVLSSLYDYSDWFESLDLEWPRVLYGRRRDPDSKYVRNDSDLPAEYAQYEGVLAHPYGKEELMGQWRNRYLHAIWAHTLIAANPAEVGPVSDVYLTAQEIEGLTQGQRDHLVLGQREAYTSRMWDAEFMRSWLRGYLNG